MGKEYSAGAIIYRQKNDKREFLIVQGIRSRNWGYPKGHLEKGETAKDAAQREVFEEVGLKPKFDFNFETHTKYPVPDGNVKEVTLFLAQAVEDQEVKIQEEEILDFKWLPLGQAQEFLTNAHRKISMLNEANDYINKNELS